MMHHEHTNKQKQSTNRPRHDVVLFLLLTLFSYTVNTDFLQALTQDICCLILYVPTKIGAQTEISYQSSHAHFVFQLSQHMHKEVLLCSTEKTKRPHSCQNDQKVTYQSPLSYEP